MSAVDTSTLGQRSKYINIMQQYFFNFCEMFDIR